MIFPGERPLHALRERGVEYVEVRLLDLNPFVPVGITAQTLRFLDVFLLHCLLADSPQDTPEEIRELGENQHLTAARGREPGLMLLRQGQQVRLTDWAAELLQALVPIAAALDATHGGHDYSASVADAQAALGDPDRLPSAQVLAAMAQGHDNAFVGFTRAMSAQTRESLLALPWSDGDQAHFEALSAQSVLDQQAIEAADTMPFEIYRQLYLSPDRLGLGKQPKAGADLVSP